MANREEWEREINMRQMDDGSKLDKKHVLPILDSFELDVEALNFCADNEQLQGKVKPSVAKLTELRASLSSKVAATTVELECQLQRYDTDGDGTLDHDEFCTGVQTLVPGITSAQIKEMLDALGIDKTGKVDYRDFATFLGKFPYPYLITMPAAAMDLTDLLAHD
eukprot:COSAG01_NODE_27546_length_683_cov_0.636986_1_plen_164_part_10